jgi:hypothetical protein
MLGFGRQILLGDDSNTLGIGVNSDTIKSGLNEPDTTTDTGYYILNT